MGIEAIVVSLAGIILVLDRFGLLERFGLIRREKTAEQWAAELELSDRRNERLQDQRDSARLERDELAKTRSLEPVIDLLVAAAESQAKTLDKLASFNGTLQHLEDGLGHAVEALKFVAGFVASDTATTAQERGQS